MTLIGRVAAHLTDEHIPFALIGAAAMAAHGVSRSTFDVDLLTTDTRVLQSAFWSRLAATTDVRTADPDDPLAGVIRISKSEDRDVDIVVGRSVWQTRLVSSAAPMQVEGVSLPVVDPAGLILLKLYAGGSQDAWDVEQLLAGGDRRALMSAVEASIHELPKDARLLWQRLRESPR